MNEIRELIFSTNSEDVILGLRMLSDNCKDSYEIREFFKSNRIKLNIIDYLDIYTDKINFTISGGHLNIYSQGIFPKMDSHYKILRYD